MNFIISGSTDVGAVKNINQDSFDIRSLSTPQGKMVFAVLCDGMGGLSKGEVASSSLVRAFVRWSETRLPQLCLSEISDGDIRTDWRGIAAEFNEKIKLYGRNCGITIGTTLTAMLLTSERYYIINVGDTRAYEISDSVRVLTRDQTVVAREVEFGQITSEQAETDSRRSVLLQCVGASETVDPDMFFGDIKSDAVYMMCTDGFRHEITPDEIFDYFNPYVMISAEAMKQNSETLIELNKQRLERDNITVLTVRTF